MSAPKIIKGNELMLFDANGKSYAFATNHTLSFNVETSDTSSKDHGMWGSAEATKFVWEITTENLYTDKGFEDMFDATLADNKITVAFGIKNDEAGKTVVDDYTTLPNWKVKSGNTYYKGSALITSLTANANNGENATYSVTFTGVGKLEKVTTFAPTV